MEWHNLSDDRKKLAITQVANQLGLPPYAIEKDWWVTMALRALFELPVGKHLVFKGGTSLSKAWQLIERFSEDIDLAIDRSFLGFEGDLTKNQRDKLRKKSCLYVSTDLKDALQAQLERNALKANPFSLHAQESENTDTDPQTLELTYSSLFQGDTYLPHRVLIEIGSRSLREPAEDCPLQSLIGQHFNALPFADKPFLALTVNPQRTFIEKVLLLHEEFLKSPEKSKPNRMSRHLYDIHRIMDTDFGFNAVQNDALFQTIVAHRKKYTPIKNIDYSLHTPQTIQIIPPTDRIGAWKQDYQIMKSNMIYGDAPSFETLLKRMEPLKKRFELMGTS
jgi:hypothetical protein